MSPSQVPVHGVGIAALTLIVKKSGQRGTSVGPGWVGSAGVVGDGPLGTIEREHRHSAPRGSNLTGSCGHSQSENKKDRRKENRSERSLQPK